MSSESIHYIFMQFIVPLKKTKQKKTETGYDLDLLLDLNVTIYFLKRY